MTSGGGSVPATRTAAYCLCLDDQNRLLMSRLTNVTTRPGAWTLPGGGIDFGEHPEVAALRELHEETGLVGRIDELVAVDSIHHTIKHADGRRQPHHGIRIVYRVEIVGGTLRDEPPGNSTDHAAWHTRAELATLDLVELGSLGVKLAYRE